MKSIFNVPGWRNRETQGTEKSVGVSRVSCYLVYAMRAWRNRQTHRT